jgi:hypothetical protein
MRNNLPLIRPVLAGVLFLFLVFPVHAVVNGEATLLYWFSEDEVGSVSANSDNAALRGELWFNDRWGFTGGLYQTDPSGSLGGVDYFNIDGKFRVISATDNNWLAVGLGYQNIDAGIASTSGFRLTLDGHLSLMSILQGYARVAWMPDLDNLTLGITNLSGGSATEFDIGLMLHPVPLLGIWGGWRTFDTDFDQSGGSSFDLTSNGPYLGIGLDF